MGKHVAHTWDKEGPGGDASRGQEAKGIQGNNAMHAKKDAGDRLHGQQELGDGVHDRIHLGDLAQAWQARRSGGQWAYKQPFWTPYFAFQILQR